MEQKIAIKPASHTGILFQNWVCKLITLISSMDAYLKLFHHCICSCDVLLLFGLSLWFNLGAESNTLWFFLENKHLTAVLLKTPLLYTKLAGLHHP